jgi:hypothetical protein
MVWSQFDEHPIHEDMVDEREQRAIDRHIDELDFRYKDNHEEIENLLEDTYPDPNNLPENVHITQIAQIAGRKLEDRVGKIREFYTEFDGTDDMREDDYRRTLEYLGLIALENGYS